MKAVVFTLGCKVNECESDSLISGLINLGYEVSDKLEQADLYIVNTCAVTAEAEKKSRQMASRIRKLSSDAKIIFTGCAVQKDPKQFENKSSDFLLTGVFNKNDILSMLNEKGNRVAPPCDKFEELLPTKSLRTRTYVKVQDGCNNFCSYCIIPYLRGRTRSRNPKSVYQEIKSVNAKEVVINGINLSVLFSRQRAVVETTVIEGTDHGQFVLTEQLHPFLQQRDLAVFQDPPAGFDRIGVNAENRQFFDFVKHLHYRQGVVVLQTVQPAVTSGDLFGDVEAVEIIIACRDQII